MANKNKDLFLIGGLILAILVIGNSDLFAILPGETGYVDYADVNVPPIFDNCVIGEDIDCSGPDFDWTIPCEQYITDRGGASEYMCQIAQWDTCDPQLGVQDSVCQSNLQGPTQGITANTNLQLGYYSTAFWSQSTSAKSDGFVSLRNSRNLYQNDVLIDLIVSGGFNNPDELVISGQIFDLGEGFHSIEIQSDRTNPRNIEVVIDGVSASSFTLSSDDLDVEFRSNVKYIGRSSSDNPQNTVTISKFQVRSISCELEAGEVFAQEVIVGPQSFGQSDLRFPVIAYCPDQHSGRLTIGDDVSSLTTLPQVNVDLAAGNDISVADNEIYVVKYVMAFDPSLATACSGSNYDSTNEFCQVSSGLVFFCSEGSVWDPLFNSCVTTHETNFLCKLEGSEGVRYGTYNFGSDVCVYNEPVAGNCPANFNLNTVLDKCVWAVDQNSCLSVGATWNPTSGLCESIPSDYQDINVSLSDRTDGGETKTSGGGGGGGGSSFTQDTTESSSESSSVQTPDKTNTGALIALGAVVVFIVLMKGRKKNGK